MRVSDTRPIRVFISSPADVRPERLKAEQIVARLDREFAYHFHVEAVLWEREPLVASLHFQDPDNIPQPRGTDIVVVILWSRLGVPLPEDQFRGAISGRPVTGTEWEFEDALASARERNTPDLLLYRKTARISADLDDEAALDEARAQRAAVQDFIGRWFRADSGPGYTAASHSFVAASEFEQLLYDHLRALLERRAGPPVEGVAIRWRDAPYRGLPAYEFEHAPIYFGRTWARNELRELLVRRIEAGAAFVLVFGASGSGKSSLVKAGLLPDLTIPGMIGRVGLVRRAVMRPSDGGDDPLQALAATILSPTALPELAGLHYSQGQLAGLLRDAPAQAVLPMRQGLMAAGKAADLTDTAEARLVIVIDQLEEIFTIDGLGAPDRDAFIVALDALAKSGLVWVVATMRSDFFDRLDSVPGLAALSEGEARFLLLPPGDAEIGQIIRQPALEAGLRFEHDPARGIDLDEIIREAAVKDRGALPLLSFLLDQLWQRRGKTGVLPFAAFDELGGLEGAIGSRAEEVFQAQKTTVQNELVPLLRELVSIERGRPVSRTVPLSRFPEGSQRRALVDAFVHPEARLLVSDGGQLRLAHEALLTHWPRAKQQVDADARDLELRGRLEQEAERWRATAPRDRRRCLIGGLPLAEARALMTRWGNQLPAAVAEFVVASRRHVWRQRLRVGTMVASAPLVAALIAVAVWTGMVWYGVRAVEAEMELNQHFVPIPGGCFDMGSADSDHDFDPESDHDEGPLHRVCLKPFELNKFEVTQVQWRRVMVLIDPNPSAFSDYGNQPVENVTWNQVKFFIRLMSFFGRHQYRLPSEAEWEYAARAGTPTSRYWGNDLSDVCKYENVADQSLREKYWTTVPVFADCKDGFPNTAPVGSFRPNPWELHDMLGNVSEWVEDCYVDNYRGAPTDGSPVILPPDDCTVRVLRGGNWKFGSHTARAADRSSSPPSVGSNTTGFRLARVTIH